MELQYFNISEFDSPDQKGSGKEMKNEFLAMLDEARDDTNGVPMVITSGYRTTEHNDKVGGVDSSTHTKGFAADIRVRNSWERYVILTVLIKIGFSRFGIGNNFIHVDLGNLYDNDMYKEKVMWKY